MRDSRSLHPHEKAIHRALTIQIFLLIAAVEKNDPVGAPMIADVAKGLDYLHSLGIVHHAIKPAHILVLNQQNQVVIADFGIAMRFSKDPFFARTNDNYGSVAYADPERRSDHPPTTPDVYTLAAREGYHWTKTL